MSVEAEQVTVIVYGARHLPTKKKGKRKYSVIFGVGHSKFRTDVVQDFFGNPDWNNESQIAVDNADKPLLLIVTEKEEILGQVSLTLSDLPRAKTGRQLKVRLQQHKKCPEPEGELLYEAWVSKLRASADTLSLKEHGSSKGTFKKIKGRLSHSPLLRRKFGSTTSSNGGVSVDTSQPLPGMGPTASQSNFELGPNASYSNLQSSSSKSMYSINTVGNNSLSLPDSSMHKRYGSFTDLAEEEDKPEVTGLSPKEGSVEGGTRITIRGVNLGLDKADVVGLTICGANCLSSIEYESPRKLYATTKVWKPCTGNIVIETQSGGKGTSLVQFTYKKSEPRPKSSAESSPVPAKKAPPTPTPPPRRVLAQTSSNQSLTGSSDAVNESGPPPPLFTPTLTEEIAASEPIESPPKMKEKSPPPPLFSPTSTDEFSPSDTRKIEKEKTPPPPLYAFDNEDADRSSKSSDTFYRLDSKERETPPPSKPGASTFYDITFIEDSKDEDVIPPPEVSGIRPREGPVEGGTRLTIRGKNLGVDKEDVVGLYVCGADCLATLHYTSPSKIHCTTKSWRACTGGIIVETQTGGKGTSLVEYSYQQSNSPAAFDLGEGAKDGKLGYTAVAAHQKGTTPPPPISPTAMTEPVYSTYPGGGQRESSPGSRDSRSVTPEVEQNNNIMEGGDSPTAKQKKKTGNILARLSGSNQDKSRQSSPKREMNTDAGTVAPVLDESVMKKLAEFEKLQAENSALKEANANMKGYIDDLVSKVIVLCPNALCVDDGLTD